MRIYINSVWLDINKDGYWRVVVRFVQQIYDQKSIILLQPLLSPSTRFRRFQFGTAKIKFDIRTIIIFILLIVFGLSLIFARCKNLSIIIHHLYDFRYSYIIIKSYVWLYILIIYINLIYLIF